MSEAYPGRVMALDLGSKRIGVAISDPTRTIAKSYGVVKRKSREEDFARYQQILAEQQVTLLLVGLPTTSEGEDSDTAVWIRNYIAEFSQQCAVPVEFWDESFTTVQAEESLRLRGKRGKKARQQVDAVAAAFILQSYLDAHRQ
ncbi:Holliday junction resolvase RuvX [Candidatus Leptofilum sp.]|uniref:Holliday junction resolvase RuvX n=1 Tax=Candidatus Leptofilum sp. TaxID=3241576 RepID=UPI003B594FCE